MGKFVINGGKKLYGEVDIQCAKNAMLPLIASTVLLDFEVAFLNAPKLLDVLVMLEIVKDLGGKYRFEGSTLFVDCSSVHKSEISKELSSKIRASVFMTGGVLSRVKKVEFYSSGGCNIGSRPIDMHLDGLESLGAKLSCEEDKITLSCDKIIGKEITLKCKSVGVTENLIITAVLGEGTTLIKNCAQEPEVVCLADFLNGLGAKIKGAGTSTIQIEGVKKLTRQNTPFTPISDRIEVGTFILSTMTTGGEILIKNADFSHNSALIKKIYNNACKITVFNDRIYIKSIGIGKSHGYLKTEPYPYFPTDLQPQFSVYSSTLKGVTVIEESIFDNRFNQLHELTKFGAKVKLLGKRAIIEGVPALYGAKVKALDLRGGAAMVIAGLKAIGETTVEDSQIIERGYVDFAQKLSLLGADVKRID